MKKVFLLFFLLFMIAVPCNDAVGQYLYYHGSYDHGYYGHDSNSRFSAGYEYNHGSHLSSRHHSRIFGYINSNRASESGSYYGNPDSDCYRGSYYSRRHIVEERYYGYPGYPYAPAPRHPFKPYYN